MSLTKMNHFSTTQPIPPITCFAKKVQLADCTNLVFKHLPLPTTSFYNYV